MVASAAGEIESSVDIAQRWNRDLQPMESRHSALHPHFAGSQRVAPLRETVYLSCAQNLPWATSRAHGKQLFCHVSPKKHTANVRHTAKPCFDVCFSLTHGKVINLSCDFFFTRQSNKFVVCFFCTWQSNKKNFSSHLETFYALHIQHVALYIKIWYIFIFICYI